MRNAISPRLAISTFSNIRDLPSPSFRTEREGTRRLAMGRVRWVEAALSRLILHAKRPGDFPSRRRSRNVSPDSRNWRALQWEHQPRWVGLHAGLRPIRSRSSLACRPSLKRIARSGAVGGISLVDRAAAALARASSGLPSYPPPASRDNGPPSEHPPPHPGPLRPRGQRGTKLLDQHQRHAVFDRLCVLDEDLDNSPGACCTDFVHHLHR